MLELRLVQGGLLKKVLESLKDLVNDANFDCSASGFSLQAMDSGFSLLLRSEGFEHYRCDRNLSLGMNLNSMAKMLKCAGNDDIVTIKADDASDSVTFMFESPNQDKIADFEMKLMDIDSEHLGIPEAEFQAIVRMPSAEFARIFARILAPLVILVVGDIGTGNIVCRQNPSVDKPEEATIIEMEGPKKRIWKLKWSGGPKQKSKPKTKLKTEIEPIDDIEPKIELNTDTKPKSVVKKPRENGANGESKPQVDTKAEIEVMDVE
ncbi:Proliferating cell nuclear antigen, PCNA [Parasponia andersonii]|uniref:DNA sliding clamp PCNA n=1 Tax=Parasponia andersonii TaxID=3476 RepID=A0A2P5AIE5_PARAD|nr:Proliferating cell nuclear antigen, PCNA [Parasponia andersonii]